MSLGVRIVPTEPGGVQFFSHWMMATRSWAGAISTGTTPKVTGTAVLSAWGCYLVIEDTVLTRDSRLRQSMQLASHLHPASALTVTRATPQASPK